MAQIGGQFRRNERVPSKAWMAKRKIFLFHLERVTGGKVGGEFGQPMLDVASHWLLFFMLRKQMSQDFFPWCPFSAQGILFKICLLLATLSEVVQGLEAGA